MRKAIRQLVVTEINGRKTVAGQAARLGLAEVVVGDLSYSQHYFERLKSVTPARLRAVLQQYLQAGRQISISLNPAEPVVEAASGAAKRAGKSKPAKITEYRARNGARLLLQPDRRLPNVHLRLLALGGPATDPVGCRGATGLMATLLTRDTKRRSAAEVARTIEAVGGAFYPFTGNNSFGLAAEVLPSEIDVALGLLGDAVTQPTFQASSFAVERDAQLADLSQDEDDVVTFARKHTRRLFFGEHPLAVDASGDAAGLTRLKLADLRALYRRLVVAPNLVLSVAGDFDPAVLGPKLKRWLDRMPAAPKGFEQSALVAPAWSAPAAVGDFVEKQPRQQAVVLQAFPGPGVNDDTFYTGEVADELFSGMSSRLFERVREDKGLAYFVRSARITGLRGGMFYFYAGTAPGKEKAVLTELNREIARVAAGRVTLDELTRCKTRLLAGRRMSRQTNGARAMHAGLNALYGHPVDDDAAYEAGVQAVDAAALARFAKSHLKKTSRTQVVVRP